MKNILTILLLLPLFSFSQKGKVHQKMEKSDFYIDSVKIDQNYYFHINPLNIESLNVVKKGNGQIFITLKENIKLESLDELNYENIEKLKNRIFIIDNTIIKHPSEILIDKSEIGKIQTINSSEFENQNTDFTIVKITTKSEERRIENNKKEIIMIRGMELNLNE